jgi:hypothetical protein
LAWKVGVNGLIYMRENLQEKPIYKQWKYGNIMEYINGIYIYIYQLEYGNV